MCCVNVFLCGGLLLDWILLIVVLICGVCVICMLCDIFGVLVIEDLLLLFFCVVISFFGVG